MKGNQKKIINKGKALTFHVYCVIINLQEGYIMENKKDLFDLEIKKDNMENNNELEAQSLGPAIKATRQVCPKATRFVTVSCKKSDCQ